jgi:hypothetical protein
MRKLIIFCPEQITGGPEALHQLSEAANRQGIEATMAYGGIGKPIEIRGSTLLCANNLAEEFLERYASYAPVRAERISLSSQTLCIFPETFAETAFHWQHGPRAIWWLSVDNFRSSHPHLLHPRSSNYLFSDESILHFYQSHYAQNFLRQQGARNLCPLYDYTADCYLQQQAESHLNSKSVDITFFPRKGAALAHRFLQSSRHDLRSSALERMSQCEIMAALASSHVYIDFGHHPGKDRVPREAACMGNIVFLHKQGAAVFFEDHPLDSHYLFTTEELMSGNLLAKVKDVLQDTETHFKRQAQYRHRITMEKQEFDWQVRTIFGCN